MLMDGTPYNFIDLKSYTQAHTSGRMTEHRTRYGFTSWGYAPLKRAEDNGLTLRRGEASKCAFVRFENGGYAKFYNEEQFE